MINPRQRNKNKKRRQLTLLPYKKSERRGVKNSYTQGELSGSEFLLSFAGMFASGAINTSERIEEYVAEALKKKYN